jgi:putative ABC transport system permease protein
VCAVLLVGCANVANLMLSRAIGRRQELAVRAAMGAEPGAIARQMLVESGIIALAAGVIGIAVAFGATRVLSSLMPASIAKIGTVRVDATVLGFTLLISVGVALVCGIVPAVRGARGANRAALADAARGASRGRSSHRFNNSLVVAELALAMILVVSAGLLINSFSRLIRTDAGFRAEQMVRMKVALPDQAYPRGPRRSQFFESVLQQAAAIPGVQSAALVSRFPLHDNNLTSAAMIEGSTYAATDQPPSVDYRVASPGYFATMGIPVLVGRAFDGSESTDSGATLVTVLNRVAATTLFGTTNVVGKRLRLGGLQSPLFTVVGVVGDIRDGSLREQPRAQAYVSSRQALPCCGSIVVRYSGVAPGTIVGGIRQIVSSLDKSLPVYDVQTIDDVMSAASLGDRFTMTLLSCFAFIALVLAALGTYGVIAYGVAERTREIGVRMALGARAGEVRAMVLREGMALFVIALPFALLGMWWARQALGRLLFNLPVSDPTTILTAVGTLAAATAVACYVPARRASRVDPTIAIRS